MIMAVMMAGLSGCFGGESSPSTVQVGATLRYELEDKGEWLEITFGDPRQIQVDTLECTAVPMAVGFLQQQEGGVLVDNPSNNFFCLDKAAPMIYESLWHNSYLNRTMTKVDQVSVGSEGLLIWLIAAHLWRTPGTEVYQNPQSSVPGTIALEMTDESTILTRDITQHFADTGPPSTFQSTIKVSGPRGTIPDKIEKHSVSIHEDSHNRHVFEHDDIWELMDHDPGRGLIEAQGETGEAQEMQRTPGPWPTTSGAGLPFQLEEARFLLNASTDYQDYLLSHPEAFPIHIGYVAYEHPEVDRTILIWHFILMDDRDAYRVSCLRVLHNQYAVPFNEDYCEDGKEFQMGENYTTFQRPASFRSIPDVLDTWRKEQGDPERDPTVMSWSLVRPPSMIHHPREEIWESGGHVVLEVSSLPTEYEDTGAGPLYSVIPPATASGASFGPISGWNLSSGEWYTIMREGKTDLSEPQQESPTRSIDDDRDLLRPLRAPQFTVSRR